MRALIFFLTTLISCILSSGVLQDLSAIIYSDSGWKIAHISFAVPDHLSILAVSWLGDGSCTNNSQISTIHSHTLASAAEANHLDFFIFNFAALSSGTVLCTQLGMDDSIIETPLVFEDAPLGLDSSHNNNSRLMAVEPLSDESFMESLSLKKVLFDLNTMVTTVTFSTSWSISGATVVPSGQCSRFTDLLPPSYDEESLVYSVEVEGIVSSSEFPVLCIASSGEQAKTVALTLPAPAASTAPEYAFFNSGASEVITFADDVVADGATLFYRAGVGDVPCNSLIDDGLEKADGVVIELSELSPSEEMTMCLIVISSADPLNIARFSHTLVPQDLFDSELVEYTVPSIELVGVDYPKLTVLVSPPAEETAGVLLSGDSECTTDSILTAILAGTAVATTEPERIEVTVETQGTVNFCLLSGAGHHTAVSRSIETPIMVFNDQTKRVEYYLPPPLSRDTPYISSDTLTLSFPADTTILSEDSFVSAETQVFTVKIGEWAALDFIDMLKYLAVAEDAGEIVVTVGDADLGNTMDLTAYFNIESLYGSDLVYRKGSVDDSDSNATATTNDGHLQYWLDSESHGKHPHHVRIPHSIPPTAIRRLAPPPPNDHYTLKRSCELLYSPSDLYCQLSIDKDDDDTTEASTASVDSEISPTCTDAECVYSITSDNLYQDFQGVSVSVYDSITGESVSNAVVKISSTLQQKSLSILTDYAVLELLGESYSIGVTIKPTENRIVFTLPDRVLDDGESILIEDFTFLYGSEELDGLSVGCIALTSNSQENAVDFVFESDDSVTVDGVSGKVTSSASRYDTTEFKGAVTLVSSVEYEASPDNQAKSDVPVLHCIILGSVALAVFAMILLCSYQRRLRLIASKVEDVDGVLGPGTGTAPLGILSTYSSSEFTYSEGVINQHPEESLS